MKVFSRDYLDEAEKIIYPTFQVIVVPFIFLLGLRQVTVWNLSITTLGVIQQKTAGMSRSKCKSKTTPLCVSS